ncbi:MAG TPA: choice-of-anchor D domain-containing protein [Bacteroidia bacterium]|nr:choice-of-anchor D domain-containing protein [Bacteroidia bacterium]
MKTKLTSILFGFGMMSTVTAQSLQTGPSTSITPYLYPSVSGASVISVLSSGDVVGNYTMSGLPDGMGAIDNGGTTFTLIMNHEFNNTQGNVHAHGSIGAFISKWVINKSNFQVISGSDLINDVKLWTGSTYTTYNATNPSTLTAFNRFCAGELAPATAFYNAVSGKGTQDRIFMNGEESGNEGRAFAHIVTGSESGVSYELPHLGKASWENAVANPYPQDKTLVMLMDDSSPAGQVYCYVGNKNFNGNTIEKAGLFGGKLYGIAVLGLVNESSGVIASGTKFNLIDMGSVAAQTGSVINTNSNNYGVSNFLRPEDGAWDPNRPSDFYFNTTNSFSGPSRLYRLRFTDINFPELGGTITTVLNGTEGQKMLDNIGFDNHGQALLQEDPGNNIYLAKVYQYRISDNTLTTVLQHDSTRFKVAGPSFLTSDEETSGIFDIQGIKGAGWFLLADQAHYALPAPMVEGGQLLAYYNPLTAQADAEINLQGNSQSIASGNTVVASTNNTDFGSVNLGQSTSRSFVIQNTSSTGTLIVSSLFMSGTNAGDFMITGASLPFTLAPASNKTIQVTFSAPLSGTRTAILNVVSSDYDEKYYSTVVRGTGVVPEINVQGNSLSIVNGNTLVSSANNTQFGTVQLGSNASRSFVIQNLGTGTLSISDIHFNGANSNEFTVLNAPSFPLSIQSNGSFTLTVQFMPLSTGTRSATMFIQSNDADESAYQFAVQGKGDIDAGVAESSVLNSELVLYPNPSDGETAFSLNLKEAGTLTLLVQDLSGRVISGQTNIACGAGKNELTLNTSTYQSGAYLVTMRVNGISCTKRLLVNH